MIKKLSTLILVLLLPVFVGIAVLASEGIVSVLDADEIALEDDVEDGEEENGEEEEDGEEDGENGEEEEDGEEENGDEEEEDDENDEEDEDEDEDEDEKDPAKDAMKKIENAEKKIDKAEGKIEKKEAQGKDVTAAIVRLDEARELLESAILAFEEGDYDLAEELAREAKRAATYAQGKDIRSNSRSASFGRELGECIKGATHAEERNIPGDFDECFAAFKEGVDDHVDDKLSDDDQDANDVLNLALTELADTVEGELRELLLDFADFTFSGVDEEQILADVEEILDADIEEEEKIALLIELIEEVEGESIEDKFEDDVIPFKDTDDGEWFFNFVEQMEEEGCIVGFVDEEGNLTGEFGPGNETLFGEGLKFVLQCILDVDPEEIGEDDFWAYGYALNLFNEFSDLLSSDILDRVENSLVDDDEFSEEITRGEFIQMIIDVLNLDIPEATEAPFSDVPLDHPYVDAIAYALSQGVVSGDADTGEFRPDEVLNRAEVSKIIILAKELF